MTPQESIQEDISRYELRLLVIGQQVAVLLREQFGIEQYLHRLTDVRIGYETHSYLSNTEDGGDVLA